MDIGVHCDVRKGYVAALARARLLGCGAMQLFTYPRHHDPSPEELRGFRAAAGEAGMRFVAHVRYVPFLAAEEGSARSHSARLLARESEIAAGLGAERLVLHLGGFAEGSTRESGLRRFAEGVAEALEAAEDSSPLVLENVPGGGRRLGGPLEDLSEALELLQRGGIEAGICLDTAHAWAQGYDIGRASGMSDFLGRAKSLFGPDRIQVFHLNDTRAALGSHRESHWVWGEGRISPSSIEALLKDPELRGAAGIAEAPAGKGWDAPNLAFLKDRGA